MEAGLDDEDDDVDVMEEAEEETPSPGCDTGTGMETNMQHGIETGSGPSHTEELNHLHGVSGPPVGGSLDPGQGQSPTPAAAPRALGTHQQA